MILPASRFRIPLVAAASLLLVVVATFLILDLGGGSLVPSGLPVVQIGQVTEEVGDGQASSTAVTSPAGMQDQPGAGATVTGLGTSSPTVTTASGSSIFSSPETASSSESTGGGDSGVGSTTGSTLRQTVTGGVRVEGGQGYGGGTGGTTGGNR